MTLVDGFLCGPFLLKDAGHVEARCRSLETDVDIVAIQLLAISVFIYIYMIIYLYTCSIYILENMKNHIPLF